MDRPLAFDLLLLSWDDDKGKPHWRSASGLSTGVGGALLLDAILAEAVTVEDDRVRSTGRSGLDPLVDEVVTDIARRARPPKLKSVVSRMASGRRVRAVRDRMVGDGILFRRETRVLGIFPMARHPPADPGQTEALRARIRHLLVGASDPEQADERDVILASLAGSTGALELLVARGERKQAKQRAEDFRDGTGVSEAVHAAIRETQAVIAAGAAVVAAGGASD